VNYSKIPDEVIVKKIVQEGRTEVFGVLYDRYYINIYNKCLSFADTPDTAEDLTRKIFVGAFARLKKYNNNSNFSTWFYSLAYGKCIDHTRRQYLKRKVNFFETDEIDQMRVKIFHYDSEIRLLNMELDELRNLLKKLPPEDRTLLLMKYQDNMSLREIGQQLDLSENDVNMLLQQARERIITIKDKLYM
jgi:RNA polymerase sigma-70 factor (ECF subfamily)